MTAAEILALAVMAMRIGNTSMTVYERMMREGRDKITPEELEEIKAAQGKAETKWEATLQQLRDASSD